LDHAFRAGTLRLAVALLLFFVFFRHRRMAFSIISVCFLLVCVGPGAFFHPTVSGIIFTLVAGALFCGWVIWMNVRYPYYKKSDFKKLFDHDLE
jgi:energy-coupling factor transporter transmembrane protein EcfT